MDKYTGTQLTTDHDKQNIEPFMECADEISITVQGTHYMRWQLPLIIAYSMVTPIHKRAALCCHI